MEGLRNPGVPQAHAANAGAHKRDPVVAAVGIAALATAAAVAAASRTAVDESRLREAIEVAGAGAAKLKKARGRKIAGRCSESKERRPKKSSKASSERSSSARVKGKPRKAEAAAGAHRASKAQARAADKGDKGDSGRARPTHLLLGANKKTKKPSESAPPAARHAPSAFKLSSGDLPPALRPDHASRPPSHVRGASALRVDLSSAPRSRQAVSQKTSFTVVPSGAASAALKTPTSSGKQKSLGKKASAVAVPIPFTAPNSRAISPILPLAPHLSTSNVKSAPVSASLRRHASSSKRHASGKSREEPSSCTTVSRVQPPAEKPSGGAGTRSSKSKSGVHKAASALSTATSVGATPSSHPRLLGAAASHHLPALPSPPRAATRPRAAGAARPPARAAAARSTRLLWTR